MSANNSRLVSDLAIPPGEVLAEEIAERGISPAELASSMGVIAQVLDAIITGEAAVTDEIARKLNQALGIEASYWMNLEADYQMTLARECSRAAMSEQER